MGFVPSLRRLPKRTAILFVVAGAIYVVVAVSDAARDVLAEQGYDEVFGARPLRRVIQNKVEDQLSDMILQNKIHAGETALIDAEDNEIVVRVPVAADPVSS